MAEDKDIPAEAGERASVDPVTGAARGSGSGAGGGQSGEDYSIGAETGSGFPIDGDTDKKPPAPLPSNDQDR